MTKVGDFRSIWSPQKAVCINKSLAGDGNAFEESNSTDRHQDYLAEQDKRDYVALSPGDVDLTTNTTQYNVLGRFYSYRPL